MHEEDYPIRPGLTIPGHEVWFEFSHASGPGGQKVNKTASAVTLCFHLASSGALSAEDKILAGRRLANRINADGVLRISSEEERSQIANRKRSGEKLCELLAAALHRPKVRRASKPSRSSIERRLSDKRFRSARKADRGTGIFEE